MARSVMGCATIVKAACYSHHDYSHHKVDIPGDMPYMYDNREIAMLSIRLPKDIEARLERLAKETGRTESYYARQAILEKIEDMEDVYLAEQVLDRVRMGKEKFISAGEMWRGLDD